MRILFIAQARMGDVCCAIPAYRALRSKYKDDFIAWQVVGRYGEILPSSVDEIIKVGGPYGLRHAARKADFDKFFKVQPMFRHKEWENSRQHIIELTAKWAGVKLPTGSRKIRIEIPQKVKDKISEMAFTKKNFVTICSSPCYSTTDWSYKIREMVVTEIQRTGMKVATVGGKDGRYLGADKSYHGKFNLLETIEIISRSKGYIGPDNGTSWLACAAKRTPKIMLINEARLRQGITGFAQHLDDKNIKDYFYNQIKPNKIATKLKGMMT